MRKISHKSLASSRGTSAFVSSTPMRGPLRTQDKHQPDLTLKIVSPETVCRLPQNYGLMFPANSCFVDLPFSDAARDAKWASGPNMHKRKCVACHEQCGFRHGSLPYGTRRGTDRFNLARALLAARTVEPITTNKRTRRTERNYPSFWDRKYHADTRHEQKEKMTNDSNDSCKIH